MIAIHSMVLGAYCGEGVGWQRLGVQQGLLTREQVIVRLMELNATKYFEKQLGAAAKGLNLTLLSLRAYNQCYNRMGLII